MTSHHPVILLSITAFILLFLFWKTRPALVEHPSKEPEWSLQLGHVKSHSIYTTYIPKSVTAIIQRKKPDAGIHHIIQHLSQYPFIKEIYVYDSIQSKQEDLVGAQWTTTRFEACQQDLCYFQDDVWLNPFLDTLYTMACEYPWIVNTRLVDYMRSRNDLKYGSFVAKELIANDSSFDQSKPPYIIVNPSLDKTMSEEVDRVVMFKGMDVRSSCANDQCLFVSNLESFHGTDYPAQNSVLYHSYHHAVDQDTRTCWYSFTNPQKGDYFGLMMIGDIVASQITLYTSQNLDLGVSVQSREPWIDCDVYGKKQKRDQMNFRIECPGNPVIKSIRFKLKTDLSERLELCSIQLGNFVV